MQAAIQATRYDDEKTEVIGGVTVPGEETILYTATSNFITDAVAVEQIGVDYATLALNSLTPIRFTIRNTGLNLSLIHISGTAASRRISIRRHGTWRCATRADESLCSALMR